MDHTWKREEKGVILSVGRHGGWVCLNVLILQRSEFFLISNVCVFIQKNRPSQRPDLTKRPKTIPSVPEAFLDF